MLPYIFSCVSLVCTIVCIILKIKHYCDDEPVFSSYLLALCIIFTILPLSGGIQLSIDANNNYNKMLEEKEYIETNFNSEDILTSLDVNNRYFQYQFKLERMKESKEDGWIASMYYFYDIDKLELEIKQGE